jgi:hypothetical protein
MPHGVHTAVNAVQSSRSDPPRDPALVEPNLMELPNRHNTMLQRGDLGHGRIERGVFLSHTESKPPRTVGSPPGA